MIVRTVKDKENPYYIKNRTAPNDRRLSWKAKGIHDYLMSKPDNWEANIADITNMATDGESAVRSGVNELIKLGYMRRVRVVGKSGQVECWRLDTYETPQLNPDFDKPPQPDVDEPDVDEPDVDEPDVDEPDVDEPDVDEPDVENRGHNNYRDPLSNEKKENLGSQPVESPTPAKRPQQSLSSKAKSEYMPGLPMPKHKRQRADAANNAADVKARLPLVEKLIDIWAVRGLTDDPDYDGAELGECHKVAEKLLRDGETAASLDVHYKAYLADDWRNTPVSPSAFARFIAQAKQKAKASTAQDVPTFRQWCYRTYNLDKPEVFLGIPLERLNAEYEQSIRTH